MPDFILPTNRLIIRAWQTHDIAPFHAMGQDPVVMAHLGPLMSLAATQEAVARQMDMQARGGRCFWALERKDDGRFIGFCGVKPGPAGTPLAGRTEIGWRLAADCWGQGYAREAATACLDWCFQQAPDEPVWAITTRGNSRSWGLMERLGMVRQQDLDFDHPGVPAGDPLKPHITYSIRREQWTA